MSPTPTPIKQGMDFFFINGRGFALVGPTPVTAQAGRGPEAPEKSPLAVTMSNLGGAAPNIPQGMRCCGKIRRTGVCCGKFKSL